MQGPGRYAPLKETHEQVAHETTQEQSARLERLLDDMARDPVHYEADRSHYGPLNDTHQQVAAQQESSKPTKSRADREAEDAEHATNGNREKTDAQQTKLDRILEGMANDRTNSHSQAQTMSHGRDGKSE